MRIFRKALHEGIIAKNYISNICRNEYEKEIRWIKNNSK